MSDNYISTFDKIDYLDYDEEDDIYEDEKPKVSPKKSEQPKLTETLEAAVYDLCTLSAELEGIMDDLTGCGAAVSKKAKVEEIIANLNNVIDDLDDLTIVNQSEEEQAKTKPNPIKKKEESGFVKRIADMDIVGESEQEEKTE